jgi:hypothetical protein
MLVASSSGTPSKQGGGCRRADLDSRDDAVPRQAERAICRAA